MVGQSVHKDCREKYTDKKDTALLTFQKKTCIFNTKKAKKKSPRSSETLFELPRTMFVLWK